jgi:hypothetical protein
VCVEYSSLKKIEPPLGITPIWDQAGGYQRRLVEEDFASFSKAAQETEAAFFISGH